MWLSIRTDSRCSPRCGRTSWKPLLSIGFWRRQPTGGAGPVLNRLAEAEERHAAHWEGLLTEAGVRLRRPLLTGRRPLRDGLRTLFIAMLAGVASFLIGSLIGSSVAV